MKQEVYIAPNHLDYRCALCQNTFFPVYSGDIICSECEASLKCNEAWISQVFHMYKGNDFEALILFMPMIRQQLSTKAQGLSQQALEAYRNANHILAKSLWQEARRYDPQNIQAAFNLAYLQWKLGEIEYSDFISSLHDIKSVTFNDEIYQEFMARIEYAVSNADNVDIWVSPPHSGESRKRRVSRKPAPELMRTIAAHNGRISACKFSPDGSHILTAGYDGRICLWDFNQGREEQSFVFEQAQVSTACLTPDGLQVFASTDNYVIHLLDMVTGEEIRQFRGHKALPVWVGVAPYGRMALSGSWDGTIGFWDLQRSRPMNLYWVNTGPINNMWMSGDGMCLLITGVHQEFRLLDLSGEMNHSWFGLPGRWPFSICSTDSKHYALCGYTDGNIILWNLDSGDHLKTLHGHRGTVSCLALSNDSRYAISSGDDRTVKLWDVNRGSQIVQLYGSDHRINCLDFSKDGSFALSAGDDGQIRIWFLNL